MNTHDPCVLLTGFEPFGGETINPSWRAVAALDGERIGGHRIVARTLPTAFTASLPVLHQALEELAPACVLAIGQAGGRAQVSLERVAINLIDARIPDNDGEQPIDAPVVEGGPSAYFSTLPLKSMLTALRVQGVPAEISHSAGTYVCNHVFYALMHALREQPHVRAGFVHVPFLPEQAIRHPGAPSMSHTTLVESLRIMVESALNPPELPAAFSAGRED